MDIEIRADGTLHIEGYVNAVERDSRTVICPECGKCVEQIRAGAFGEALRAAKNVDILLNHDKGRKLGSTSEGTLSLYEDSIGLRAGSEGGASASRSFQVRSRAGQTRYRDG